MTFLSTEHAAEKLGLSPRMLLKIAKRAGVEAVKFPCGTKVKLMWTADMLQKIKSYDGPRS